MGEDKTFTTSAVTYPRYVRTVRALKQHIDHSLKPYGRKDMLCAPAIFVFDHFIVFEIVNRDDARALGNHSIPKQASHDGRSLMVAEMDQLSARSAARPPKWSVQEGKA